MDYKALLRYCCPELIELGNLAIIPAAFTTDYIAHAGERIYRGHAFLEQYTRQIRQALPDIRLVALEVLARADDRITWQQSFRATHRVALRGIPPSGKEVKWSELVVSRFAGERIAEEWVASDLAGQLLLRR